MKHSLVPLRATLLAVGLVAAATQVGCVASPADGHQVNSTSDRIHFSGYHIYGSTPLRVKAYNFSTRRYDTVANATSRSTPLPASYWDDPLYSWSAPSQVLASRYWEPGRCAGARALIKGETDISGRTYGMYSWNLEKNAEGCTAEHRNNSDWVANCSSSSSNLTTRDYRNDPRAIGVRFSLPTANSDCTGIEFPFNHPVGEWSDVRASLRIGSRNYGLTCEVTSMSRTTVWGRCRHGSSMSRVQEIINLLRTTSGVVNFSAVDQQCRSLVRASGSMTVRSSSYDYNWSRWISSRPQCSAPPPPPPPPSDPRWFDIRCSCANVGGTSAIVDLDGCLDSRATSPATGASLMCGYAAQELQRSSGLATSCAFISLGSAGSSCSPAGRWVFDP